MSTIPSTTAFVSFDVELFLDDPPALPLQVYLAAAAVRTSSLHTNEVLSFW